MMPEKRKYIWNRILFISILVVALVCRDLNENRTIVVSTMLGAIQTVIYVGLVAVWGVSVSRRIIHRQTRMMLQGVSALLVFWFLQRGMKYYVLALFQNVENIKRYFWYSYYIPMLLLPVAMLFISLLLRKPETFRLPRKAVGTLFSVSTVLFLAVITNDLHQLVFRFPQSADIFTDAEYTYGILYYPCFAWMIGCAVASLVIMLKKCRLRDSKKFLWAPLIPMIICICYVAAYTMGKIHFLNDIIVVDSFLLIAILETAISVGLIPSNNHYEDLFKSSERSGFITDENLAVMYASQKAEPMEAEVLQKVIKQGSVIQDGKRINCSSINGGYIFWKDDITKLLEINEILEGTKEELRSYGSLLEEENKQKKRRQKLVEQQNLYEIIRRKTEPQQGLLSDLALMLQESTDKAQAEKLLHKITVIGAYVKRRSNLCLLAGKSKKMPLSEAELCIRESITYIKLSGISAATRLALTGEAFCETVGRLYDFFEYAVELSLDTLTAITVFADNKNGITTLRILLHCDADMNRLKDAYPECNIENDGNIWFCSIAADGGERA